MPLVRVSAVKGRISPDVKKKICQEMHDVIRRHTPAPSEAVWVMFDDVPEENWMIHETMLSEKKPPEIFAKDSE